MKVLLTPYSGGSIAHVVRCLAIADALKRRGHEILFTTTRKRKSFVEQAGYQVFGEGHAEVNLNDEHDQSIRYFRTNRSLFLDWLGDELRAAETFRPDVVVNSPSFFGPLIQHKYGIPYVTILNAQWLSHFRGLLGLGKAKTHLGHRILRRVLRPVFTRSFARIYLEEIRTFYRELNVGWEPSNRAELHEHNPILIPSVYEFEPLEPDTRDDVHFIGPLFWHGFEDMDFERAEAFADPDKPLLYVSLGGSIFRRDVYDKLIRLLQAERGWNVVMGIGPNFPREWFPADSARFQLRQYVPGLKAAEQSDVVINTASHGTVMQALWHGKPLVVVPHNIDQGTIAARVEELGVGVNLNRVSPLDFAKREQYFLRAVNVRPAAILGAVDAVLKDRRFLERAGAFAPLLTARRDAAEVGADYVELYAKRKRQ